MRCFTQDLYSDGAIDECFFGKLQFGQELLLNPVNLPAPMAGALQQKHIVRIKMRPDAAAGRGIAHH